MAKQNLEKGIIEIYTGDAKGKSTAAFGLAIRAAGHGFNVRVVQFMKNGEGYGETVSLKRLAPEIEMYSYGRPCFIRVGGGTEEDFALAGEAMAKAEELLTNGNTDILILDEINNALYFKLVTLDDVMALLDKKPDNVEVVLTGRNAPQELIERADLVTEMKEIKHPYNTMKLQSRKGIEY